MKLKNYEEFLLEKEKFEYGCVMLQFDFPHIVEIQSQISDDDLYTEEEDRSYGKIDDPHVTLLYGLHEEVKDEEVKSIVEKYIFTDCEFHNASLFQSENFEVLKFDAKGKNIRACNKELRSLPHTSDFPKYHPHLTIAYLKPRRGKKYVKALKNESFELIPTVAVYSKPDGTKVQFQIKKEDE